MIIFELLREAKPSSTTFEMDLEKGLKLALNTTTSTISDIYYSPETLPQPLVDYLDSAKRCVNPQCNHVYFDTRVQDVEFVDFCGLYRVPLHHVSYITQQLM